MFARIRTIAVPTLLTVLLAVSAFVVRGDAAGQWSDSGQFTVANSGQNYGVRLRKLHLVRPDLIPYPLSLEVYC